MRFRLPLSSCSCSLFSSARPLTRTNLKPAHPIFSSSSPSFSPFQNIIRRRTMATETQQPKFKYAACQLLVSDNKANNIANARKVIDEAAANGAKVVALPECFDCPYSNACFPSYAEEAPGGEVSKMLSEAAKQHKIYLIGGSIPEKDGDKLYNTCLIYGPDGNLLGKHRKVHLFDIDVPGKMKFTESETLSPGNTFTVIDTEFGKIGVAICYDIRFPELAMLYAKAGAKFLIYPGAFNMVTGPAHWELLQRARAVDNQLYVSAVSPARNPDSTYQAWGHTTVVSPWGEVIGTTDHQAGIVYAEIDLAKVEDMRQSIPVYKQKRHDLYQLDKVVN